MLNNFYSIGISHWNCPLEIREQFSMNSDQASLLLKKLKDLQASALVISTCNRTQIFAHNINVHQLKKLFIQYTGNHNDNFKKYGFVYENKKAIQHLFEVSIGLDSQILGDLQIFSQVKEGVERSKKLGLLNAQMDRLLQFVFQANKEVQSNTIISKGAASVAHAAVLKIRQKTENLAHKKIVLFGIGEIGQRTLENLKNQTSADITIVNRTQNLAQKLAEQFETNYAPQSELKNLINQSQIVIVATASKNFTLSQHEVNQLDSKTLFIDLSVPRNIDPKIAQNNFVELITIDELSSQADQTLINRKKDIPKAKTIINLFQMEFEDWLKLHRLGPVIKNLEHYFENLKTEEIKKYQKQYQKEELQKIKPLIDSVVKKISSKNIEYLRKRYRYNDDILEVIKEMYKLK